MRLLIDTLVALMLAGVLAGVVYMQNQETSHEDEIAETVEGLRQLHKQILLQAALERVPLNSAGYPETVEVEWFDLSIPRNTLVDENRPWLEVAGIEQRDLVNPPNLTAGDPNTASFWYNPYQGIVRARVPADTSDKTAVALYNRVNATTLASLFASDLSPGVRDLGR